MPLMVYGVARVTTIHDAIDHWPTLIWTYAGGVLIGSQLLIVVFVSGSYSLGEVIQFHALLNLSLGLTLLFWLLASFASSRDNERIGAMMLGLTAAATTVFILLSGIEYFAYAGEFALPVSRVLSEWISW